MWTAERKYCIELRWWNLKMPKRDSLGRIWSSACSPVCNCERNYTAGLWNPAYKVRSALRLSTLLKLASFLPYPPEHFPCGPARVDPTISCKCYLRSCSRQLLLSIFTTCESSFPVTSSAGPCPRKPAALIWQVLAHYDSLFICAWHWAWFRGP